MASYIGGLAQLGERLPCTQKVIGSIPISSTNGSPEEGYQLRTIVVPTACKPQQSR